MMFIAFEGIDGCGKSTQAWKLARYLSDLSKYNHVLITREPYKARDIRKILSSDEDPYSQKEKLTKLFFDDRVEHVHDLILPTLSKGGIVITDRYKYSTICYQAAQGQEINNLIKMHHSLPIPDLVYVVNTSLENCIFRMKKDLIRNAEQKFEKNQKFLEKVRLNYLNLPNLLPNENIIPIHGDASIDEIFEGVINHPSTKKILNNI